MLSEIDQRHFPELKERHLEQISLHPLINAVVSEVQDGFVYADERGDFFFICTKSGFSFFNGPEHESYNQAFLQFLLHNKSIPEYIHLYRPNSSFEQHLETSWPKYKVRRRAQFRNYHKEPTYAYEDLLPAGFQIAIVQELDFDQLERAFGLNFGSRYWNSRGDFLNNAVGACIVNEEGEPVAICYSACVVDGIAEMDTLVLPEHRGKRFMRIVSEPFFNQTVAKNLIPHWDTFTANSPSYIMAQKFNLTLLQEYDLLSLFLR